MDVREKLVELLCEANSDCVGADCFEGCKFYYEKDCLYNLMADVMISNGVTVQELGGCEYCNGLPFSQMEDFTMPNAYKKDYDIVTIRYCPMCGRRLQQPPKGE